MSSATGRHCGSTARAAALAAGAGVLAGGAFVALAFGQSIGESLHDTALNTAWAVSRWPLAALLMAAALTALFRWCPNRTQPPVTWLAVASIVSVGLWVVLTAALGLFFRLAPSFGQTYGPLAGTVALLVWAQLSALAVLFGGAVAAEMEDPTANLWRGDGGAGHRARRRPAGAGASKTSPPPGWVEPSH